MTAFTLQMTLRQSLKYLLFRLLQKMLLTPAQVDCTSLSFYLSNIHLLVYILFIIIFIFSRFYFFWMLSFIYFFYFTILYWFCHTSTCIHRGCTRVPHPEPPSHSPPHTIPLGHPSALAPSLLHSASNLDWQFTSHMILYMFQCHSPKSSPPPTHTQSPKDCFIHLCLFCCLAYRVVVTIFLNSICMHC